MVTQRQLDRFKLSLAVVDVGGILAWIWTGNWVILVYLALFNFLIILIDVVRRGMVVHKPEAVGPALPDDIPIDPDTGNLYTEGFHKSVTPHVSKVPTPAAPEKHAVGVRNVPSAAPLGRSATPVYTNKTENPFAGIEREVPAAAPLPGSPSRDPHREEIERALEEWMSK